MKETRYYLIDLRLPPYEGMDIGYKSLSDEEFMKISEEQGLIMTQKRFQEAFNEEEIDSFNYAIKILGSEVL